MTAWNQGLPIGEIDVLWMTAGLGCDGDTVAITAATQQSIEEMIGEELPWTPRVRLQNPLFWGENGEGFLERFHAVCMGRIMPGFQDKFMPLMNQPPGSLLSSGAVQTYGRAIYSLRKSTRASLNRPPAWRRRPEQDEGTGSDRVHATGTAEERS